MTRIAMEPLMVMNLRAKVRTAVDVTFQLAERRALSWEAKYELDLSDVELPSYELFYHGELSDYLLPDWNLIELEGRRRYGFIIDYDELDINSAEPEDAELIQLDDFPVSPAAKSLVSEKQRKANLKKWKQAQAAQHQGFDCPIAERALEKEGAATQEKTPASKPKTARSELKRVRAEKSTGQGLRVERGLQPKRKYRN